jgi:hypothetical protein
VPCLGEQGRARLIKGHFAAVFEPVTSEIREACWCYNQCLLGLWSGHSGFDGLVVSMLASGTQDRGFEPRRIFRAKKSTAYLPSEGKSVPCRRLAAFKKTPTVYVEVGIAGQIDWPFLAQFSPSLTEVSHVA